MSINVQTCAQVIEPTIPSVTERDIFTRNHRHSLANATIHRFTFVRGTVQCSMNQTKRNRQRGHYTFIRFEREKVIRCRR